MPRRRVCPGGNETHDGSALFARGESFGKPQAGCPPPIWRIHKADFATPIFRESVLLLREIAFAQRVSCCGANVQSEVIDSIQPSEEIRWRFPFLAFARKH